MALWQLRATASGGAHGKGYEHGAKRGRDQSAGNQIALRQVAQSLTQTADQVRGERAQGALDQEPDTDAGEEEGERAQ